MLSALVLFGQTPSSDLQGLSWMSGCWAVSREPLEIEEHWSKPAGGTMLGFSRTIKGGRTVFSEFMQIAPAGDKIVYTARIGSGQPGTPFTLTRLSDNEAVFENPKHDFPQRIIYRRSGDRVLHARIDGTDKGKTRAEDFPMQRSRCP
jgi:hypothetical protein